MESNCKNIVSKCACVIWFFVVVLLSSVESYRTPCSDSDNLLNIDFTIPGVEFLDREDVACKSNFDDITTAEFRPAVQCRMISHYMLECEVKSECSEHRKSYLQRLRSAFLQVLDEVVLKLKGIRLFNDYLEAKELVFNKKSLANLTGVEIIQEATSGKFNILQGFSISNKHTTPTIDAFNKVYGRALELYVELLSAEPPTGLLKEQKCSKMSDYTYPTELDKQICVEKLLKSMKDNAVASPDSKLISLLEETLRVITNYLSEGGRTFSKLKIPFTGPCASGSELDPTSDYAKLVNTIKILNAGVKKSHMPAEISL